MSLERWRDPREQILVAEGPIKALSLVAACHLAIGLGGVTAGGHDSDVYTKEKLLQPHPELLSRVLLRDRKFVFVFDAGRATNPMVAYGEALNAIASRSAGAIVYSVALPPRPDGGDWGPDDFLHSEGSQALQNLIAVADPADPIARVEAIGKLDRGARAARVEAVLKDLVFLAHLHIADPALLDLVGDGLNRISGLKKRALNHALEGFRRLFRKRNEPNPNDDQPNNGDAVGDESHGHDQQLGPIRLLLPGVQVSTLLAAWRRGPRHSLSLAVAACLRRRAYNFEQAKKVVEEIVSLTGDEEGENRIRALADTFGKPLHEVGGPSDLKDFGLPTNVFDRTWAGLLVPKSYAIDAGGSFIESISEEGERKRTRISRGAVWIDARAIDVDTGDEVSSVSWIRGDTPGSSWLPRGDALVPGKVTQLCDRGAPFDGTQGSQMVKDAWFVRGCKPRQAATKAVAASARLVWRHRVEFRVRGEHRSGGDRAREPRR
ncbi:MAG TPA: DUF3854 domain-containing protein, partial [Myxococcales bacterium]